jgi:uncharacterized membrane protein
MNRLLCTLMALAWWLGEVEPTQGQYLYTILDVPGSSVAFGVNNSGQVVGFSGSGSFLWSGGTLTILNPPAGWDLFWARGVNDSGQIVGSYYADGRYHGFLLSGGRYTTLDLPGSVNTLAFGINNAGQVVGRYDSFDRPGRNSTSGFLLENGSYRMLDVPGSLGTLPYGINNTGQVVGLYYPDLTGNPHGFLFDGSNYTRSDVPGSSYTYAFGINDSGQIVGLYDGGGFVLSGGKATAFNPWFETTPNGINNAGQVVGSYLVPFVASHAFLATPIPEPATLVLLGIATAVLLLDYRRFISVARRAPLR